MITSGRHRRSAARWILVVNPPRDRPSPSRHRRSPCSNSRFLSFDGPPCERPTGPDAPRHGLGERNGKSLGGHIGRRRIRRPRSVVMGPHDRGVDRDHPLLVVGVAAALQPPQHPVPGAIGRPCAVSSIDGPPRSVRLRQIPPRRACAGPPQHPVDHPPMRGSGPTLPASALHRQKRLQRSPPFIGQVVTIMHPTITTRTGYQPLSDTP